MAKGDETQGGRKRRKRESWGQMEPKAGRYYPSYVGPDGKRHRSPISYSTATDARGWLSGQRTAIESGTWTPATVKKVRAGKVGRKSENRIFGEYAAEYVKKRLHNGKPLARRTVKNYEWHLENSLAEFKDKAIAYITKDDVDDWWRRQLKSGKVTKSAQAYQLFKGVMAKAGKDGLLIGPNPVDIQGAAGMKTGKEVRTPSDLDVENVLAQLTSRWQAMFLIEAWTQLRFGELRALRRKDILISPQVDSEGKEATPEVWVNVSKGVVYLEGEGYHEGDTKSKAGMRNVQLPPHVVKPLVTHLDGANLAPGDLLFPSLKNPTRYLAYSTYHNHWTKAIDAAGVEYFNPHALRHYGATLYAIAGATTKELQEQLGHSTIGAAMIYQSVAAGRREELAARVSDEAKRRVEKERTKAAALAKLKEAQEALAALDAE